MLANRINNTKYIKIGGNNSLKSLEILNSLKEKIRIIL